MLLPKITNPAHKKLYLALLFNFLLFGTTMTVVGATVPQIIRSYQWKYTTMGILLASGSIGYFISALIGGFLIKKLGPKTILLTGLILEFLSLFFFMRTPGLLINFILFFLIGIGQGCAEIVTNYQVILMEDRGNEGRLMSLMHSAFCLGAILAPFAVGIVEKFSIRWMVIFTAAGILIFLVTILFTFLPFIKSSEKSIGQNHNKKTSLFSPLLFILFITILLYVGIELGVSNWISEYFVSIIKTPVQTGAFMVSVLWLGIFAGRVLISTSYRGKRQEWLLTCLILFSCFSLVFLLLSRYELLSIIAVFLIGTGYSGIYPIITSLVGRHYRSPEAVGILATGGGLAHFHFHSLSLTLGTRLV